MWFSVNDRQLTVINLIKINSMEDLFVDVTFDFNDQSVTEKEIFLDFLTTEKWIKKNSDQNWRIGFKDEISSEDKISIIIDDLKLASKVSKIKSVDYAIILNDSIFIDSL